MATARVTDHFRQRKAGVERSSSGSRKPSSKEQPPLPGVTGTDAVTDSDISQEEQVLRAFDLDTRFGPCAGMTRLERWNRAEKFGLKPPQHVKDLLGRLKGEQWDKSIWDKSILDDHV